MKQLDKDLSKIFFNSVEEMNECYGIDADIPSNLYSNTDLVCYEIVKPSVYEYVAQYVFNNAGFYHLDRSGEPFIPNHNEITLESEVYESDSFDYVGGCFVYVRVNEYLRKHLEKTLLGCEFIRKNNKLGKLYRRFVHSVKVEYSEVFIIDQWGVSEYINDNLFYPDDHSDPIPYKEWVKKINKQDVDG